MSARYEKARAIAEAAANHWDKFQDAAGINWLTDAILAATAVSQPSTAHQGELEYTKGRRDFYINEAQRLALLVRKLGGDPEPNAVSQPPTSRHGAGDVEALRAALEKIRQILDGRDSLDAYLRSRAENRRRLLDIGEVVDEALTVLPAQPGPAPVDPQT